MGHVQLYNIYRMGVRSYCFGHCQETFEDEIKGIKKTVSSLIYKVVYSISSVRVTAWAFVLRGLNRDRKDQDTTHFSGSF